MSISTYVYGIVEADEEYMKMKKIYDACIDADVDIPKKVTDYFDDNTPDDDGIIMELDHIAKKEVRDMEEGYKIKVSDIPSSVKYIKFVNSY